MSNSEVLVFTPFGANPCFEGSHFNGFVVRMYSGGKGVECGRVSHQQGFNLTGEARGGEK